jgi:hypothetical protein
MSIAARWAGKIAAIPVCCKITLRLQARAVPYQVARVRVPNCIDKHSHSFSGDMLMLTSWTKLLAVLTLGSTITLGACAMDDANSSDDTTGAVTNKTSGTIRIARNLGTGNGSCDVWTWDGPGSSFKHAACTQQSRDSAGATVDPQGVSPTMPPAAAGFTNFISNAWTGGNLGVIHVKDGSYTHGTYDAPLPPLDDTFDTLGWSTTAGWYTGPGFCTAQLRSDDGGNTFVQQDNLGSGQHFIGANTSYIVRPFKC